MTGTSIVHSSFATDLKRYGRSWGLWLILLAGPVGARFMVARDDGSGVQIAIGGHLPVLTSATLGVSLGIVVSTLLLPAGFIYLRSNTTRQQPWQIAEVTPASRVAVALGRFAADLAVLAGMLTTLTLAGWFLGWLIVSGPFEPLAIAWTLWIIAAPALIGLAALRALFDAVPLLRRGLGELLFFIVWMTSLVVAFLSATQRSSLSANLFDFPGFVRPLAGATPAASQDISIGVTQIATGRVPLDVIAGLSAPGYIASRLTWIAIAVGLVVLAGLVYRPHRARQRRAAGRIARWLAPGDPPAARSDAPAARPAALPWLGLIVAEVRLIGAGRAFKLLAAVAALVGLIGDYRHMGSPAALLLLVFALSAHAGRSEARGLRALTVTAGYPPLARRAAFVVAGCAWALAMALPAALVHMSPVPLTLALVTGGVAAIVASLLATVSGSGVAARLVLLIAWYGYLSS